MPIRDISITLFILWTIPHILRTPWIGILVWSWLGFMSPHRQCWGFAYSLPFSFLIGGVLLYSFFTSKVPKKMIWTSSTVLMLSFLIWMFITTFFAHYQASAWHHFDKISKIFLMAFVTIMLVQDKRRLQSLIIVIAVSIGFYGIKGGIFTLTSGGSQMVLGPRGSFMSTHGEIGMGMSMVLPLLRYLQLHITDLRLLPKEIRRFMPQHLHKWIKLGFGLSILLTGLAILGTQSRGAMLAGAMVMTFLILKSRQKFTMIFAILIVVPLMLTFMPAKWWNRMDTITADESHMDKSSSGRVNAWMVGIALANNSITGGGYNCYRYPEFVAYAPNPNDVHDAHSIYFEVIGEHGWPGFALYMALALTAWLKASKIARQAKKHPSLLWLSDLARMSQVSLAAYATSGMFIGQAYFDFFYIIVVIIVVAESLLAKELKKIAEADDKALRKSHAASASWRAYGAPQLNPARRPQP